MNVKSSRFGVQKGHSEKTIFFPSGIAGFENDKEYQIFHEDKKDHMIFYLQSLENPNLTINTVRPEHVGMKYDYTLSNDYLDLLGTNTSDQLISLCVISKGKDGNEINTHPDCPIIINPETRRGIQIKSGEVKFDIDKEVNKAA